MQFVKLECNLLSSLCDGSLHGRDNRGVTIIIVVQSYTSTVTKFKFYELAKWSHIAVSYETFKNYGTLHGSVIAQT